jgi:glutathione S-transferase
MAGQSKILEVLPCCYGYVVFTALGSAFVNMWMAFNVMRARKEYNVKYPLMYSPDNEKFNCIQRAHQNTLETYPQFLLLLTIGGLQYPRVAAGAGIVCLLGRIAYAKGYYTGDPEKRRWGAFGHIGMLALLGSCVSLAVHQLKWIEHFGHKHC